MSTDHDEHEGGTFASPPCFMHEVDPAYMGLADAADPVQRGDVMRWRKAERERLIKARLAISPDTRRDLANRIAANLKRTIGAIAGLTVSAYWPFRGEPDLRSFLERVAGRSCRAALPVVIEKGQPLVFRAWTPGDPLERGIWNIPVPCESGEPVIPDIVIAPVVGFDAGCYRLGYGGGFFDRTLAAMPKKPRILGVGYEQARIATIYPQPHDIAMDAVFTEHGVTFPSIGADGAIST